VDARTPSGMNEAFGVDHYPTAVLYSSPKWLAENKEAARRLARATQNCLRWIQEHSADEIGTNMPDALRTEPDADRQAIAIEKAEFSSDGSMSPESALAVKAAIETTEENGRLRNVDLSKTFTNEFVTNH
jgi:NitT/TauT family transport system substrate-binding protein